MVRSGTFRQDLYHRLRVFEVFVPPLHERGADIELLARKFLADTTRKLGKPSCELSPEARVALREHDWPGNVRELQNAIERAVILTEDGVITPQLLAIESAAGARESGWFQEGEPPTGSAPKLPDSVPPAALNNDSLEAYFRKFVLEHQDQLSETELAKRLGVSRKTLWERRTKLGIPRPRTPSTTT
jgi:DNA-binding NtrC family response regulator